jgi:hypothetical protein
LAAIIDSVAKIEVRPRNGITQPGWLFESFRWAKKRMKERREKK